MSVQDNTWSNIGDVCVEHFENPPRCNNVHIGGHLENTDLFVKDWLENLVRVDCFMPRFVTFLCGCWNISGVPV